MDACASGGEAEAGYDAEALGAGGSGLAGLWMGLGANDLGVCRAGRRRGRCGVAKEAGRRARSMVLTISGMLKGFPT